MTDDEFYTYFSNLTPFQSRYGTTEVQNSARSNEFIAKILSRKSVRFFNYQPLEQGMLELLIAAAQSAPTSSMLQPWSVIAIESLFHKNKLIHSNGNLAKLGIEKSSYTPDNVPSDPVNLISIMSSSVLLIWCADCTIMQHVTDENQPKFSQEQINQSKDAIDSLNLELRCIIDTVIAAQTFSLAAESLGLGTLYIGGFRVAEIHDILEIPQDKKILPLFGMAVGYPKMNLDSFGCRSKKPSFTKPRLPQELVVHKEKYKILDEVKIQKLNEYNNLMEKFYQYMGKPKDWFFRVINRTKPYHSTRSFLEKYFRSNFKAK
jgi:nitroreductase